MCKALIYVRLDGPLRYLGPRSEALHAASLRHYPGCTFFFSFGSTYTLLTGILQRRDDCALARGNASRHR